MSDVRDVLRRVDETVGARRDIGVGEVASPEKIRQRLEAAFACDHRPRAALRLEREIEILERLLRFGRSDARGEIGIELALLGDAREIHGATFAELAQVLRAIADIA